MSPNIGQPQEALRYYQQALPIRREKGDRAGEATTLNNIGRSTGHWPAAGSAALLPASPAHREKWRPGRGEATTLNNIGAVYRRRGQRRGRRCAATSKPCPSAVRVRRPGGGGHHAQQHRHGLQDAGQPQEALRDYQQALPIRREVGDRAGEAITLNNIGGVYHAMGQPQEGAGATTSKPCPSAERWATGQGEATTLNNIGAVYQDTGQPQEALRYFQQALPIVKEVGNRAGEATTLNNIGAVYRDTGQPQEALRCYQQASPIRREVGDRAEGAATHSTSPRPIDDSELKPPDAAAGARDRPPHRSHPQPGRVRSCWRLFTSYLGRTTEAIDLLEQSTALFQKHHLERVSGRSLAEHEQLLARLRSGMPEPVSPGSSEETLNIIRTTTIAVLTGMPEKRAEWRGAIARLMEQLQPIRW